MKTEFYVNGVEFEGAKDFIMAEQLLKRTTSYNSNFGPYLEDKLHSRIKEIRRFVINYFEYVEVSTQVIGNNDHRMIWFQKLKKFD